MQLIINNDQICLNARTTLLETKDSLLKHVRSLPMTESYAIFHGNIKTFNNIPAVVHLYFNNVGLFEFNHLVLHFMKADYDVVEEVLTETYGLAQATKYQESIRDIDSGMVLTHLVIDRFGPEHLLSMTLKKN